VSDFVVTWDWGARSESLRRTHAALGATKSFLLTTVPMPVSVVVVESRDIARWDEVTSPSLATTPVPDTYTAKTTIPDIARYVRLDFKIRLTIGSATATCLDVHQLFVITVGDLLQPLQYSFPAATYGLGTSGPVSSIPAQRRRVIGTSPLIAVTTGGVQINCEFLDVTELWWANWAAKDQRGWYLDPDLGGRADLLRVLAWTSGTAPMLWFVAVSPQAVKGVTPSQPTGVTVPQRADADIVFFRAPAGFNSFRYTSDAAGFLDTRHGDTTMRQLGRWLLQPLSISQLRAKRSKMGSAPKPADLDYMSLRLLPYTAAPAIDPKDPIDVIKRDAHMAFRGACVEAALSRSPRQDVAFLPLGFDGSPGPFVQGGYSALTRPKELKNVLDSARRLLWMRNAVGQELESTPSFNRSIWLLGSSAANATMFTALQANVTDVDRIISCDATPVDTNLLSVGVKAFDAASKAKTTLRAFVITTPNAWKKKSEYEDIEKRLRDTHVDITMLPVNADWDTYWTYPPTATSNGLLFEVLREWDGHGLASSKRMGDGTADQWLFWHEWSVHGGHLIPGSMTPSGQGYVKTFFEAVLRD
jgi:hypothetical protein